MPVRPVVCVCVCLCSFHRDLHFSNHKLIKLKIKHKKSEVNTKKVLGMFFVECERHGMTCENVKGPFFG